MVPSGPSFENDNNLKLFAAVIHNAKRRVNITSPHFVPDELRRLPTGHGQPKSGAHRQ